MIDLPGLFASTMSVNGIVGSVGFSVFELGMLFCFGVCWPISIYKSLKTKRTEGKSLLFMVVVWLGYNL